MTLTLVETLQGETVGLNVVAFEAHHDDVTLFAAFAAMASAAAVITVLEGHVQARRGLPVTQQRRAAENAAAMQELGLGWKQWSFRDDDPDWDAVEQAMTALDRDDRPGVVLAPAVEDGGHEHHTRLGEAARFVFGDRCRFYYTYRRGHGRTRVGDPVVGTPDQICRKLRALACHRSQIAEQSTRPWFLDGIEEYLAA